MSSRDSSSNLLLNSSSGRKKVSHSSFFWMILLILPRVFLLYGAYKFRNFSKSLKLQSSCWDFFRNFTRQLLTFGAGENAFGGTILRYSIVYHQFNNRQRYDFFAAEVIIFNQTSSWIIKIPHKKPFSSLVKSSLKIGEVI